MNNKTQNVQSYDENIHLFNQNNFTKAKKKNETKNWKSGKWNYELILYHLIILEEKKHPPVSITNEEMPFPTT